MYHAILAFLLLTAAALDTSDIPAHLLRQSNPSDAGKRFSVHELPNEVLFGARWPAIAQPEWARGTRTRSRQRRIAKFRVPDGTVDLAALRHLTVAIAKENPGLIFGGADRWNLFQLDTPATAGLFWGVKAAFHRFLDVYPALKRQPYYVHGWALCMREGEGLGWHDHSDLPDHISGTLAVFVNASSSTLYRMTPRPPGVPPPGTDARARARAEAARRAAERAAVPLTYTDDGEAYDPARADAYPGTFLLRNPNTPNDIVLFDSGIVHRTSFIDAAQVAAYTAADGPGGCRVTVSFDVAPRTSLLGVAHAVPLYDPDDPHFLRGDAGADMARRGSAFVRAARARLAARLRRCLAARARPLEELVQRFVKRTVARHTFVAVVLPEIGSLSARFTEAGDEIWELRRDDGGGEAGDGVATGGGAGETCGGWEAGACEAADAAAVAEVDAAEADVPLGQFDCVDDDPACPPRCTSWASGKRDHWL